MKPDELISPAYLEQQRLMHARPNGYGGKGGRWATAITGLLNALGYASDTPVTVLDYGCGGGNLRPTLAIKAPWAEVREYDPAIEGKDGPPATADILVCTDVLEHVEPDRIDAVLAHMKGLTGRGQFLAICLQETEKQLPDGRGAHILVRPRLWWLEKLAEHGWRVAELAGSNPNPTKHLVAYVSRP